MAISQRSAIDLGRLKSLLDQGLLQTDAGQIGYPKKQNISNKEVPADVWKKQSLGQLQSTGVVTEDED